MLQQFPLPDSKHPEKETAVEIGQTTLTLIEEPLTRKGSLNLHQRAILARLYLATVDNKATPIQQLQEDINAKSTRAATSTAGTLKKLLDKNKDLKLKTAVARHPVDKAQQGYYLTIVRDDIQTTKTPAEESQATDITARIQSIQAVLLTQIKTPEEESDTIPIEEPTRQTILAEIEDIRKDVKKTLAITLRRFKGTSRTLLEILVEASEKCEAITRSAIAKKIKKTPEGTSEVLCLLSETLKRSHRTNLALKSQKDRRNRKRFGWYLGLKEEARTPQSEPELPASTRKLSKDQRQILAKLIKRANQQTPHKAVRESSVFEALKIASRTCLQITPAYCRYIAFQLFGKIYPERNFEDKLIRMQKIPEAELGFRITRTGPETWEAVLTEDTEILQPILAEIAAEKKTATEKNPEELEKRVHEGLKHLRAHDTAAIQSVFDVLIKNYTEEKGLSLEEIAMRSRYNKKDLIFRWLKRVQALNKKIPTLLRFNVIKNNAEKYSLTLTDTYAPTEIAFSGRSAPHPIKVEGGTNFDRDMFEQIIAEPQNQQEIKRNMHAAKALATLAFYSERGQAISQTFLDEQIGCGKDSKYLRKLKRRLFRREDSRVTLETYNLRTYYLRTSDTEQPAKPAAAPSRKPQQSTSKPALPSKKMEPDSDFAESDQESPPILDSPAQAEDFGSIADIGDGPVTLKEETIYRPKIDTDDDDREAVPTGPVTPLMELQHAIIDTARYFLRRKNPEIIDLKYLEEAVTKLNTNRQPHLIKVQSDYLSKVRKSMKKADPETGIIPAHIVIALYSV